MWVVGESEVWQEQLGLRCRKVFSVAVAEEPCTTVFFAAAVEALSGEPYRKVVLLAVATFAPAFVHTTVSFVVVVVVVVEALCWERCTKVFFVVVVVVVVVVH